MHPVKVAIVGASGYSGQELVRLLLAHPAAELAGVTSRQFEGRSLAEVFPRFRGCPGAELVFVASTVEAIVATGAAVVLLALPHGLAAEFGGPLLGAGLRVIDLSADFRIHDPATFAEFYGGAHPAPALLPEAVYGLPERHRAAIATARLVAAPGCYPTSILLPLGPLLRRGWLEPGSIVINSLSGVSGAGRKAEIEYSFVECHESARAYGLPKHRHLAEIEQELSLAAGEPMTVQFSPHLIPLNRGMLSTICAVPRAGAEVGAAWLEDYGAEPFVRLRGDAAFVDTKEVAGTNFCDLAWRLDPRTGRVILLSALDNLLKGAAGQAVQCLNLLCGWPETSGLL